MSRFFKAMTAALAVMAVAAGPALAQQTAIMGAGATFPYPLYSKMFDVYHKQNGVQVNYQSIGSGGGIRQLTNKTVDFGASDAFLDDQQMKGMPAPVVHVPICLGAVAVTYNLPGNPEIKLTPDILADIFLTKLTKWNDKRIQEVNKGAKLPDVKIVVVHRSDGSGTSFIFTDYLSKISTEWNEKVGRGKSVKWPGGLGAKGNEGVSGLVKQLPGSIGYCELAYTIQNDMPQATVRNKAGNFVKPTLEATSLAADGEIPSDTRISLTDPDAEKGYPIAGFTWILLYKEQNYDGRKKEQAKAVLDLVWWMVHNGQKYAKPLDYAPLPGKAVKLAEAILKSITCNGKGLL